MTIGAILTMIIMWLVFIGGLSWCFSRWKGSRSEWED